jgi:hypothetical protein
LCLEVGDETVPAALRILQRRCRHGQQADVAVAPNLVAVPGSARQEDETAVVTPQAGA